MHYNTTTNSSYFNGHPVNNGSNNQYGCYTNMLQRWDELLTRATGRHSRVLFVRYDARFPGGYMSTGDNEEIKRLCKRLNENSKSRGISFGVFWVREQSREKHQHYHCIALIDGNKVQNYKAFLYEVERLWNNITGNTTTGLIDRCDKDKYDRPVENGIMIRRPRRKAQGEELVCQQNEFQTMFNRCFEWGSYLCKANQKNNTPDGVRRFGWSHMK